MASGTDKIDWYNEGRSSGQPPSPHTDNVDAHLKWEQGQEQRRLDRLVDDSFKQLSNLGNSQSQ